MTCNFSLGVETWPKAHYIASILYPGWNDLVPLTFVINEMTKGGLKSNHALDNENPST